MRGAFEWNRHNAYKNWSKHGVTPEECEEVFTQTPLLVSPDIRHSVEETRYLCLGKTMAGRCLFISFTIRQGSLIRVISARDMSKKERLIYEQEENKKTPDI